MLYAPQFEISARIGIPKPTNLSPPTPLLPSSSAPHSMVPSPYTRPLHSAYTRMRIACIIHHPYSADHKLFFLAYVRFPRIRCRSVVFQTPYTRSAYRKGYIFVLLFLFFFGFGVICLHSLPFFGSISVFDVSTFDWFGCVPKPASPDRAINRNENK